MKTILRTLALAGAGLLALSSCSSMNSLGLNPFEATTSVSAEVIAAGSVTYDEGLNMNKKSKKWASVAELTQGYKQSIKIKTSDGRVFKHTHSVNSDVDGLSVGDTGTARIGVSSGMLKGFDPAS